MDNLHERVAWAIEAVKTMREMDKDITDEDLAKKLSTNKNTIGDYRRKKGLIKGIVLERLARQYGFNPGWLLQGAGEPFPGAREKYPEVCGPEEELETGGSPVYEPRQDYEDGDARQRVPGVKMSEAVRMVIEILESGTVYAGPLYLAVRQFHEAIKAEKRISEIREEYAKLSREVDRMKKEMAELEERLTLDLSREISLLRDKIEVPEGKR
ncbi:MAG: helix-turn-helix domain-containing protein [Syntrophales bacterium]